MTGVFSSCYACVIMRSDSDAVIRNFPFSTFNLIVSYVVKNVLLHNSGIFYGAFG